MAERPILSFREQAGLLRSTLALIDVRARDFILPVSAGVGATFMRLAVLALFIPMIGALLGTESGRLARVVPDWISHDSSLLSWVLAIGIATAAGANAVMAYLSKQKMGERIESARVLLSERLLGSGLRLGQQYYDLKRIGQAHKGVEKLSKRGVRLLAAGHRILVSAASLGLYLAAMAWISLPLAGAVLTVLAVYLLAFGRMTDRLEGLQDRVGETEDEVSALAGDLFGNLLLVKLASAQEHETESYGRALRGVLEARRDESRANGMLAPLRDFLSIMVVLLVAATSALSLGAIGADEVFLYVIFFLIFRRSMRHFSRILNLRSDWAKAVQRAQDVHEALYGRDRFIVPSGSHPLEGLGRGIEVRNLDFSYLTGANKRMDGSLVLKNVSLTIPSSLRTYIVGATGSGKSTFLRLLLT